MDELLPLTDRPLRRRVQLALPGSKTYTVAETEVAEFLAQLRKAKPDASTTPSAAPSAPTGGAPKATYLDPVPASLYQLPDQPAFAARLKKYKAPQTCADGFPHQKILLDYLNFNTPYRGLLVYHGLGSGKTCASIAIAEGFVQRAGMKVWVLTPKFLEANYRADMLKCSDAYRRAQHWAFSNGQWRNDDAESNYDALNPKERAAVDQHLEAQINHNFAFVHYNGLNCLNFQEKFPGGNPFDNTVVVIDEVHNLVSRIAAAAPPSPFLQLYEWLLGAQNCRVVALSGTPLNDAREFAILFNLIRGHVQLWRVKLERPASLAALGELARSVAHFSSTDAEMTLTRVPHGFAAEYAEGALVGVRRGESLSDEALTAALRKFGDVRVETHKLLDEHVSRADFSRRIRGLVSYMPDATALLPPLHPRQVHEVEMSAHQWTAYQAARENEADAALTDDYRRASRLVCDFAFPTNVRRPAPTPSDSPCELDEEADAALASAAETAAAQLARAGVFEREQLRSVYSPKFAALLDCIEAQKGARHMVFSNFLYDGLRYFAEALNAAGYERLVLEPTANSGWEAQSLGERPKYVLYAGSDREKEMYLNVFNQKWDAVPEPLRAPLQQLDLSLFLVSLAGVESVALSNVAHVHLLDPYWHPARFAQAIGRARRRCSGKEGVTPHVYLSKSRDEKTSTDAAIYARSLEKEEESQQWLHAMRGAAIESTPRRKRVIHHKAGSNTVWYHEGGGMQRMYKGKDGEAAYGLGVFSTVDGKTRFDAFNEAGATDLATFFA